MEKEQTEQHYMTCQLTEDDDSHLPNLTSILRTRMHLSSIKCSMKCFGQQKMDSQKIGNVNKTGHQRYVFHRQVVVIILNTLLD